MLEAFLEKGMVCVERELVDNLMESLHHVVVHRFERDRWAWLREQSAGLYSVKTTHEMLLTNKFGSEKVDIFKEIWQLKIQPKVIFFLWRVFMNRLPTMDNLLRRNIVVEENQMQCSFCGEMTERVNHILFTCRCVDEIWKFFINKLAILLVLPLTTEQHFWQHVLVGESGKVNDRWKYLWCATVGNLELQESIYFPK